MSQAYYDPENSANYGNYQFTTLDNVISAFMISYVGESKLINKINKTDVQFHAMRAIQELSYDVFRSVKSQEIEVPPSLSMILPHDYVNYTKLTTVGLDGVEKNIYPTGKTSNPFAITQNSDGEYQFEEEVLLEQDPSDTLSNYQSANNTDTNTSSDADDVNVSSMGRRYGLDPQHAHQHGSFYIDYDRGVIHFSSNLSGKTIILKYISDGLGSSTEMVVHKFCEEAIYKWIAYGILSTRVNIPEYIIARFKKEKFAETRKAKIRLSSIKIEEFTQVLKGMSKQIK